LQNTLTRTRGNRPIAAERAAAQADNGDLTASWRARTLQIQTGAPVSEARAARTAQNDLAPHDPFDFSTRSFR